MEYFPVECAAKVAGNRCSTFKWQSGKSLRNPTGNSRCVCV